MQINLRWAGTVLGSMALALGSGRGIPATDISLQVSATPVVANGQSQANNLDLRGQIQGIYTPQTGYGHGGSSGPLKGSGVVRPIGLVKLQGSLWNADSSSHSKEIGRLTLSSGKGQITLALTGPPQPGHSSPEVWGFTIVQGSGEFTRAKGQGTIRFSSWPIERAPGPVGRPNPNGNMVKSFNMSFEYSLKKAERDLTPNAPGRMGQESSPQAEKDPSPNPSPQAERGAGND